MNTDCVTVCPVDCIYRYTGEDHGSFPNQLYINPEECIDCSACEPACPWEAIFQDTSVPAAAQADTPLNKRCDDERDKFEVAPYENKPNPGPDEVVANKKKWGLG